MKRTALLILSLCLCFCVCGSAFSVGAAELSAETASGGTGISANVTAASKPEFTVSIPSGIGFESLVRSANDSMITSDFKVEVSGVEYLNGKTIHVTLAAPNGEFVLNCNGYSLPYRVYSSGSQTALASGDLFATFTADGEKSGYVEVNEKNIRTTGTYSGSMVFTVSLVE